MHRRRRQGQARARSSRVERKKQRVIVEGVRMIKRHTRKSQQNPNGAIVEREGSIHISNVMKARGFDARAKKRGVAAGQGLTERKITIANTDVPAKSVTKEMKARLYNKYVNEVVPALKAKHNYTNVHQIPRMEKIVVNMGVSASLEKGAIETPPRI